MAGMSQVPYELKPRDVECRLFSCEQLFQRQNRKVFFTSNRTSGRKLDPLRKSKAQKIGEGAKLGHASTSTTEPNIHGKKLMLCIWWYMLG
ncbi:hypothetical protein TNCV_1679301 [Trichonephila clavipes]|nr:hypothetical protein TNCV_1679301 [Trichonephila clavipes]